MLVVNYNRLSSVLFSIVFSICFITVSAQQNFTRKILQPCFIGQAVVNDSLGNIYSAGVDQSFRIFVNKLDSSSNIIWSFTYGKPNARNLLFDMVLLTNNQLILATSIDDGVTSSYRQAVFMKIDSLGHLKYSISYGDTISSYHTPACLILDSTGYTSLIAFDSISDAGNKIVKFNANGSVKMEAKLGNFSSPTSKLIKRADGFYWICNESLSITRVSPTFTLPYQVTNEFINFFGLEMRKFLWASDTLSYVAGAEFSGGAAFVGFVNQYQQCDSVRLFSIDQFGACNFKILDLKMLSDSSWIVLGFVDYCSPSFNSKYIIMHTDHSFNPIKTVYLNDNYLLENYVPTVTSLGINDQFSFSATLSDTTGFRGKRVDVITFDPLLKNVCNAIDTTIFVFSDNQRNSFANFPSLSLWNTPKDRAAIVVDTVSLVNGTCADLSLGLNENKLIISATVFPNPCNFILNFKCNKILKKDFKIYICNILGKVIYEKSYANISDDIVLKINVTSYENGVYILKTNDPDLHPIRFVKN